MSENPLKTGRIVLGEITGTHGVRGDIRVRVAGDAPELLLNAESIWIGREASDPEARRYVVLGTGNARPGEIRMRLEGIERREAAHALLGGLITAPIGSLPSLPEGEYYWHELVGCRVESESGEQVGSVREIWETGAHDVLVIEDEFGVRRLVPTARELMKEVDLSAMRIVVADLPGLLEPN